MIVIEDNNQKPCFVQTSQGFSVSYKNHFLYSKYNPSKVIVQTIEKLQVLPGTVFLCFSPVLGYGLTELLQKLQKDCLVFLIEADSELFVLARTQITFSSYKDKVSFISCDELANFPVKLYEMARTGKYKRVVRLDFSAGTQFFSNFYDNFTSACTNSIMTFWKNRLTLTKFGRHYSYNFFRNLKNLPNSVPITNYIHKIEKPILLLGAGQSLDSLFLQKIDFSQYFIICVDTALQPLLKRNILPDAVFIEEAQSIILKAFIGIPHNKKIHYFAGLSSVPYLCEKTGLENISFFTTKYDDTSFIKKYLNLSIMPPENPPFGSVGLTSFYYALKFRKSNDVPVFFAGLDFSYSAGKTHAKGTLAHIQKLINQNRITQIENYSASFNSLAIKFADKNNSVFFTSPSLKSYADLFISLFWDEKNIFDISDCGYPLDKIPRLNVSQMNQITDGMKNTKENFILDKSENYSNEQINELLQLLKKEKEELQYLKMLLTEKTDFSKEELQQKISALTSEKEYLFLHFPDGYSFRYEQSFLNRIRTEIDFFLKAF